MNETEIIEEKIKELKLMRLKGCMNQCPDCKRRGEFGSIIRYIGNKKDYLICGWCGKVSKIEK